jgi:hypothetical protein
MVMYRPDSRKVSPRSFLPGKETDLRHTAAILSAARCQPRPLNNESLFGYFQFAGLPVSRSSIFRFSQNKGPERRLIKSPTL